MRTEGDFQGMQWFPLCLSGASGVPGAGNLEVQVFNDLSPFIGLDFYIQAILLDGRAPNGWALTGAMMAVR